jgi:ribose transport system permease protein
MNTREKITPEGVDTGSPGSPTTTAPAFTKKRDWLQIGQASALPLIWIAVIVVFSLVEPDIFFTSRNFGNIFSFQAVTLIVTLGLLLPMTTGDFDLSVASNLGFSAMIVAVLNVNVGMPVAWAIVIAIVSGTLIGAVNAFVVVVLQVNAFIVTLATGTIAVGLTLAISNLATVGGVSSEFVDLVGTRWFGLTSAFFLAIVIAIILWFVLDFTPLGRRLLFVGSNAEVARLSGIRVDNLRWLALIGAGFFSAIAGVISVGVVGAADPSSSSSYLLPAFAGAFLGATTIAPGRFNVWGTVITVYFLATGFAGLQLLGIPTWVQQIFYGVALILAVALAELAARRRRNRRAAARAT